MLNFVREVKTARIKERDKIKKKSVIERKRSSG